MMTPYKIKIDEDTYNNKYIIYNTYKKKGPPFCLELEKS